MQHGLMQQLLSVNAGRQILADETRIVGSCRMIYGDTTYIMRRLSGPQLFRLTPS